VNFWSNGGTRDALWQRVFIGYFGLAFIGHFKNVSTLEGNILLILEIQ
jgi:hypothetical protein